MVTGVWKGRINRQKVEVKIIQKGDSLTGTCYYFESVDNYRRYSIKGYFDAVTNEAVWWDDVLLEKKFSRFTISSPGKVPLLSRADFNCPGGGKMMLDGKIAKKEEQDNIKGEVHLIKSTNPEFEDEWDYVIDNYTVGGNDPDLIDSVAFIALNKSVEIIPPAVEPEPEKEVINKQVEPIIAKKEPEKKLPPVVGKPNPVNPPVAILSEIKEKFVKREKVFIKEIPISGDSIELRFYDNAEIDGDSISLFLNGILLKQNIKLAAKPYIIKLALSDLKETNELVMVAENLGTIPPNTSYMVAIVKEERYDAYLASSEGSSAMIRLKKQ
jgi:hypothetical protein